MAKADDRVAERVADNY